MIIANASIEKRSEVQQLLSSQNLPYEDLPADLKGFFFALEQDHVVGVIGMEYYGSYGLLRSMVVDPNFRNRQIAEHLINKLEANAAASGIEAIYLLTETAEMYFYRKGYTKVRREDVPQALLASTEFSHICPVSATVMKKQIGKPVADVPVN